MSGYEKPGDYGGYFADGGASYSYMGVNYGFDVCTDPSAPFKKCSAFMGTVGVSFPKATSSSASGYVGMDYYLPIAYKKWG